MQPEPKQHKTLRELTKKPSETLIGTRFSHLVISEFVFDPDVRGWRAVVLCDCGNSKREIIRKLRLGQRKTCGELSCPFRKALARLHGTRSTWTGHGEIHGSLWSRWRLGASYRGLEFAISIQEAWAIFEAQKGLCALSGIPIRFMETYGQDMTASPDRIDSNLGYTVSNFQWVHKDINLLKGSFSEDRFVELCSLVSFFMGR